MSETDFVAVTISSSSVEELRAICKSRPGSMFAVLDACDEPRVPAKVQELGDERSISLYRGRAKRDYWAFAPYLVLVDEAVVTWVFDNLWDAPWGFFFDASVSLGEARKHLRKFLMVEDPEGEKWYFRFYDPRVLKKYLLTCTQSECDTFFGPIDSVFLNNDLGELIRMQPNPT